MAGGDEGEALELGEAAEHIGAGLCLVEVRHGVHQLLHEAGEIALTIEPLEHEGGGGVEDGGVEDVYGLGAQVEQRDAVGQLAQLEVVTQPGTGVQVHRRWTSAVPIADDAAVTARRFDTIATVEPAGADAVALQFAGGAALTIHPAVVRAGAGG